MGSSRTRDQTHVPCTGRWILNHCATKEVPPFSIWMPFISFSYLISSWKESIHSFTIIYVVRRGFSWMPSIRLRILTSFFFNFSLLLFLVCCVFFYHGECWTLPNEFSASTEIIIIMWFLSFILFICCVTFIGFHTLNQPCISEKNLLMVYNSFSMLLDSVCWYFVEDICICIHMRYWSLGLPWWRSD